MKDSRAVWIIVYGTFLVIQPTTQYLPGRFHSPDVVFLGSSLRIVCGGKQIFQERPHNLMYSKTYEVSIKKLRESFHPNNLELYDIIPNFTLIYYPTRETGPKYFFYGEKMEHRSFTIIGLHLVEMSGVGLIMNIQTKCEDYGLYQCHMKIEHRDGPPVYYHNDFYLDEVDNMPRLKLYTEDTRFAIGDIVNITCTQKTREKNVDLDILRRPPAVTTFYTVEGKNRKSFERQEKGAPCGGYIIRHLSVEVIIDKEIWDSELMCLALRPEVSAPKNHIYLRDNLFSHAIKLSACSSHNRGCFSLMSGGTTPIGVKASTSYQTLLPMLLLIVCSLVIFIGVFYKLAVVKNKDSATVKGDSSATESPDVPNKESRQKRRKS